jgi:hypothetical protein
MSKKYNRRNTLLLIRSIYQEKRQKVKHKKRKKRNKEQRRTGINAVNFGQAKRFFPIKMPIIFSFIENPNELLKCISNGRYYAKKNIPLEIRLGHVTYITNEAIALLIATLSDHDFDKIEIQGDTPKDLELKKAFINSGFYNYVKSNISNVPDINILLHQRSNKKVNTAIAKEVCIRGLNYTFKSDEIFDPLYDIIIECMSNTHNHADPNKDGAYDWWIYTYFDMNNSVSYYCFFDFGIGIFESILVKDYKEVMRSLGFTKNVDLIKDLYSGKIASRTLLPERGKGLPQIHSYSSHPNIKNLTLITNNVYSNMSNDIHYELELNFSGTFYYWELHP